MSEDKNCEKCEGSLVGKAEKKRGLCDWCKSLKSYGLDKVKKDEDEQ